MASTPTCSLHHATVPKVQVRLWICILAKTKYINFKNDKNTQKNILNNFYLTCFWTTNFFEYLMNAMGHLPRNMHIHTQN